MYMFEVFRKQARFDFENILSEFWRKKNMGARSRQWADVVGSDESRRETRRPENRRQNGAGGGQSNSSMDIFFLEDDRWVF
jgi:hypothetical protein